MVKLDTNGSGVEVVIKGCPFCDHEGTKNMRYYMSSWTIDPNMEHDRYSFTIKYCPFCGKHLPLLFGKIEFVGSGDSHA